MPADGEVRRQAYRELGSTGLRRWGGHVDEEFLPQLRGRQAIKVFKEMRDNDPVVGAVIFAVDMLLRQVNWRVEAASSMWEDMLAAQFIEECMDDMSQTWDEVVSEVLSMLVFGWSWHEVVYKRRVGDLRNPKFRSRYTDGRIGWRKMPIRAQETLVEWVFDTDGGVQAMKQLAPPDYNEARIPISKSLLFRTTTHKNNPEGRSILRNSYRPWYFKKRIEEIEGIGVERDLAGLPIAKVPAEFLHPDASEEDKAIADAFKKMVRQVRRDEQEGIVLPQSYDPDTGNEEYTFELLNTGGTRAFPTDPIITRYEQRIAMTILADFILLGHEKVGSYALSVNKTGIFRTALNAWAQSIASVFNRHEIPRLFDLNGWTLERYPEILPGEVDPPDLTELGEFLSKVAGVGMPLFPDPELESFLRESARLPEKSPETDMMQAQDVQREEAQGLLMSEQGQEPQEEQGGSPAPPNFSGNGNGTKPKPASRAYVEPGLPGLS